MFGEHVGRCLDEASRSQNEVIARSQRVREWERLMGGDLETSAAGFADPSEALTAHGRTVGRPGGDDAEDDIVIGDEVFW